MTFYTKKYCIMSQSTRKSGYIQFFINFNGIFKTWQYTILLRGTLCQFSPHHVLVWLIANKVDYLTNFSSSFQEKIYFFMIIIHNPKILKISLLLGGGG